MEGGERLREICREGEMVRANSGLIEGEREGERGRRERDAKIWRESGERHLYTVYRERKVKRREGTSGR